MHIFSSPLYSNHSPSGGTGEPSRKVAPTKCQPYIFFFIASPSKSTHTPAPAAPGRRRARGRAGRVGGRLGASCWQFPDRASHCAGTLFPQHTPVPVAVMYPHPLTVRATCESNNFIVHNFLPV